MLEFFYGWRRKAGTITLVMALGFVGGWIRSLSVTDSCQFPVRNRWHVGFVSHGGRFSCGWTDLKEPVRYEWRSFERRRSIAYQFHDLCFDFSGGKAPNCGGKPSQLMISYWSITLPLTLLSAYLLLAPSTKRPRTASQPHA